MSAMSSPVLGQRTGGSSGRHHVDFKPIDNSEAENALRAAETVYQLAIRQIPPEVEVSQELLIYPEGEVDAVTITETDVEGLQPGGYLSNNIVDFYIKFLERGLSPEHGNRFYFFNSFFFTKLLQSTASTGINPCKVDYEQLRNWTQEVNLFAKDYVFIPILKSSHWSLVIICHLSNLTRLPGETMRSPCVVHLDPIAGQHESFEGWIRSYVLQAWMDRFEVSSNGDQLHALCLMKYMEAKVPEQNNSHDCGLHVLHYIESCLVNSTSSDFSFPSSDMGLDFISPHFVREVLGKRKHIENLIHELSSISQKRAKKRRAIQEVLQSTQNLRFLLSQEGDLEACTKDLHQTVGPTFFIGEGSEMNHASTREDALYAHAGQSTLISKGDNGPLGSPEIGPTESEDRSESLLSKQQYVEPRVLAGGATHFNGSISVFKHASSTHEHAIDVQHEQSSGISRLDYLPLDGHELRHVEYPRVTESFSDMLQHPAPKEGPCMNSSEVQKGRNKRGRKMTKEETWVLLSCMLEGGRFCKGSGGRTHWNLISEEIGKKLGSLLSADQCRLRYDTLLKAYKTYKKYCMKTGKTFSEITQEECLDLKLATTLSEEMYTTMDEIHTKANISPKRMKLSSNVILDSVCGTIEVALRNVIPAGIFSSFNEDLQFTLLNLVQECACTDVYQSVSNGKHFYLEKVCRRLAILQDREPREILNYVFQLWKLDFVKVVDMVFEEGNDLAHIGLWARRSWFLKLEFFEKISMEVLCKNPQLRTYCTSFPIERSSTQYIRVLTLHQCCDLEHLDLREFPSLQSLVMSECPRFNLVTGWEVATRLASLEIWACGAYLDFPELRYLCSLREIELLRIDADRSTIPWHLSQLNECAKLRRLVIHLEANFSEIADLESLKELKFLEFLALEACDFSSIQGLSGLQALTTLRLHSCEDLRGVSGLGCLKGLTHLDMSGSGVENIEGVEELHSLTLLDLERCRSLKGLPFIGHLKALVYLDLRWTGVTEIPGREDLINLRTLKWNLE